MRAEFDAEALDVGVEGAGAGGIAVAPHRAQELGAVADLVGVLAELLEELVFGLR